MNINWKTVYINVCMVDNQCDETTGKLIFPSEEEEDNLFTYLRMILNNNGGIKLDQGI